VNVGLEKRYSHGLQFRANYTYSKFIDDLDARNELASYPGTNSFTDYYDPKSRRGLSGNDVRHRFVFGAVYDLPVGREGCGAAVGNSQPNCRRLVDRR